MADRPQPTMHQWDYPDAQGRRCVRCMKTDAEIGGPQDAPCRGINSQSQTTPELGLGGEQVTADQNAMPQSTEDELALLSAYERGRSDERARCVAKVKHWFGGDTIHDHGYECVREIENG